MGNYKQLAAWQVAMKLVTEVYRVTRVYPKDELNALTAETKRVAMAVPTLIVDSITKPFKKEVLESLQGVKTKLYELETLLLIAYNTEMVVKDTFSGIMDMWEKSVQVLNGLISYYEKTDNKTIVSLQQ